MKLFIFLALMFISFEVNAQSFFDNKPKSLPASKCLESLKTPIDLIKNDKELINEYYNRYYLNINDRFKTKIVGNQQISYEDFVNNKYNSYQIDENSGTVWLITYYPPESFSKSKNYYLKVFHPIIGPLQFYFDEKGFILLPGQDKKILMTSKPYSKDYGFTLHIRVKENGETDYTKIEDSYLEHIFKFEGQFENLIEYPKDSILNTLYATKIIVEKTETKRFKYYPSYDEKKAIYYRGGLPKADLDNPNFFIIKEEENKTYKNEVYGRKGSRHFLNDCFESLQSTYSNYFIFKSNGKFGIIDASEKNWKSKNFIILDNKYEELSYNVGTQTFSAKLNGESNLIDVYGNKIDKKSVNPQNPNESNSSLDNSMQKDTSSATFHFSEGISLEQFGKQEEAIKSYKKAIELNSNYGEAYYNLGIIYYNRGVKQNDIAELVPANNQNRYEEEKNKADLEFKKAIPYMEKAHELDPKNKFTMESLKTLYYRLKMLDKHAKIVEKMKNLQ